MNFIFKLVCLVGIYCAVNEMTIGFQGMHADKKGLLTKTKEMGFKPMLSAMMAIATLGMSQQMRIIQEMDYLPFIQESYHCLSN